MNVEITKRLIIKLVELVLTCTLLGLMFNTTWGYDMDHDFLSAGTYLGFLIIVAGLLVTEIMGSPADKVLDIYFSIVACILFVSVGALYVQSPYNYNDKNTARGAISIINGIIFFIDAVMYFMDK